MGVTGVVDGLRFVGAVALVLVVVVVVHEAGHFVVARRAGIRVDEFAVGFGPRLWGRRRGETLYSLRLLPFGGFVRLAGMLGIEGEPDAGERNFHRASIPRRMATISAGGLANLLFAAVLFGLLTLPSTPSFVGPHSPLRLAGMRSHDVFLAVDGHPVGAGGDAAVRVIREATRRSLGRPVLVEWQTPSGERHVAAVAPLLVVDNERVPPPGQTDAAPLGRLVVTTVNGRPQRTPDGRPLLVGDPAALLGGNGGAVISGFVDADPPQSFANRRLVGVVDGDGNDVGRADAAWRLDVAPQVPGATLPQAVVNGITRVPAEVGHIFSGLYRVLTTPESGGITGPNGLTGPVGVAQATNAAAAAGWQVLLQWMAFLSINLGVVNLLPIPFLDGGRFVFLVLEALLGRRLEPRRELAIHYAGLMLILALVAIVTVADVRGHQ